jgi:DNA-binding transcriptional LysR family regulator
VVGTVTILGTMSSPAALCDGIQGQLSYFLEIAQSGSFSKAAVRLSVAQPILSRQIKLLESELGVELLYRNGRGIVLSEVGKTARILCP